MSRHLYRLNKDAKYLIYKRIPPAFLQFSINLYIIKRRMKYLWAFMNDWYKIKKLDIINITINFVFLRKNMIIWNNIDKLFNK